MKYTLSFLALLALAPLCLADEPKPLTDVPYGKHVRQVLDFYPAKSDKPTPVVFYIHGGGWQGGDKRTDPKGFNNKGISVVAINYRYVKNGVEDKVEPPVKAPLEDAARALQFVRSKAAEWNLDKQRIGATGGSAGAAPSSLEDSADQEAGRRRHGARAALGQWRCGAVALPAGPAPGGAVSQCGCG